MIQISNLKLQIPHTTKRLKEKALKQLHIREQDLIGFRIAKRSLDARKKPVLYYVYTLELSVKNEAGEKSAEKCKRLQGKADICTGSNRHRNTCTCADDRRKRTGRIILCI